MMCEYRSPEDEMVRCTRKGTVVTTEEITLTPGFTGTMYHYNCENHPR